MSSIQQIVVEKLFESRKESRLTEMSEEESRKKFLQNCQANPTYKKAKSIVEKYGYKLSLEAHVEGKRVQDFIVRHDRTNYKPDIYYDSRKNQFEVQTTSYGSLSLSEYANYIESCTKAFKMCQELSKLDLLTLYNFKESDYE